MDLKPAFPLLVCALAACAAPAAMPVERGPQCNLLPAEVWSSRAYAGWSQSQLCDAGQQPLWQGTPEGIKRITRFTFTHGHSSFFRFATITERENGRAEIEFGGSDRRASEDGEGIVWIPLETRRRVLTADEVVQLNTMAEESGTFDHSVGSWDDAGRLFVHCDLLEMERAEGESYSFSSVNIGCNQPERLMPLVRHVMDLARLEFVADGRMIR